ncbi:heme ABC transporter ATP-binding protein [Rhodococcoides yunnanense]|uniref:heme ABC transporter ATP-binding protein n=1 Tax=Rhodococcoides yunnanense TaxID=278209 RepID=UPI0009324642|nr:heme ABC transporter ATP-binding protein [Rhodococcus yunnanensis]
MRLFGRTEDHVPPATAGEITLRASGVDAVRSSRTVLSGVTLDVVAGEVLAVVGPNGAGKSTALGVLAGEVEPTAGIVELHGRPLATWSDASIARRRAVLPQQHTVGFSFTVEQVVRMGRSPWHRTPREDDDDSMIDTAMAECDVLRFAQRPFSSLSGGERARVSLARVLAQGTASLLLDEPTAALDLGHQETVMEVARTRARRGSAVAVVLHDLGLAAAYADRVTVLNGGRVVATGEPRSVFDATLLSDVYGHPIEVFDHPVTGELLVLPVRDARAPRT